MRQLGESTVRTVLLWVLPVVAALGIGGFASARFQFCQGAPVFGENGIITVDQWCGPLHWNWSGRAVALLLVGLTALVWWGVLVARVILDRRSSD